MNLADAAWFKRKRRRSKDADAADVDEYNNRQDMRCVETRRRWVDKRDSFGPSGQRRATSLQHIERAYRELPPIELAAYMAKEQGTENHIQQLKGEAHEQLKVICFNEKWEWSTKHDNHDPLMLLGDIIVDYWISPTAFQKGSGNLCISAFAVKMHCDRKTWHHVWKSRFNDHADMIERWYISGRYRMTGRVD